MYEMENAELFENNHEMVNIKLGGELRIAGSISSENFFATCAATSTQTLNV